MAPRRRPCVVCGSRQWQKETTNGLITCSEGHVLQNYRTEARVLDEYGPHAMKKRAIKSGRHKKERQSKADPQLYHGDRARYHYFQCLQLILRHQVNALIRLWKLPPEFEIVCRDIWALHLSLLPSPLPAEPLLHHKDQDQGSQGPKPKDPVEATDKDTDNDSDESSSSSEEEDPEMEALLQEMSEPSSTENEDQLPPKEQAPRQKRRGTYDIPANNIAILVVGCWTLRIPIIYKDFFWAIEGYELPYLEVVSLLPVEMKRHLTKQNIHALSPHFNPAPIILHRLASRLAKRLYATYGIYTPEINAAPILWRAVRCLCGNATLYNMSKKLAGILSLPLTLHHSLAPKLTIVKRDDPERHQYDNLPPEVALIATVVLVLRLVYGLDGKQRFPKHPNDPACAFPVLSTYLRGLQKANEAEIREEKQIFAATAAMRAEELDEKMIDAYLDFCADKILIRNPERRSVIEEYFPLGPGGHSTPLAPHSTETDRLAAIPLSTDGDSLCPGEAYRIFHTRDILGCVSGEYQLVVERAARWTGVEEEYMFGVVESFERRFSRWWKTKEE